MTAEIIRLKTITTLDLQPDDVLREAVGQFPGGVFICGWDDTGNVCFSSSLADGGDVMWLMEVAKTLIMRDAIG